MFSVTAKRKSQWLHFGNTGLNGVDTTLYNANNSKENSAGIYFVEREV